VTSLTEVLNSSQNQLLKSTIIRILGDIGDTSALNLLEDILDGDDFELAKNVSFVLISKSLMSIMFTIVSLNNNCSLLKMLLSQ